MSELRTDFKDDVLDVTQNEKRKYRIIHNDDGTISLEDATVYLQKGDSFGANDLNEMNRMANQMNEAAGEILTMADDIDTLQEEMADISPRVETLEVRPTTLLCANSELYIKEVECDIVLPTVLSQEYSNYRRVWDMLYYNGELYILMFDSSASTLNLCVYKGGNWTQVNIDNGSTVREGGNLQELNGVIYIAYAKYQASMRICKYENGAIVEVGKQGLGSTDGRCCLAKDFDNNVLYWVTTKAYSSSQYACNYQSFDGVTFGENIRWYYGSSAILCSAYIKNGKLYILSQTSDGMKLFELDLVSNTSLLRYTSKKYEGNNFGITKNICGKYLSTPYNIVSGQYFIYQNASTTGLTDVFCGGIGFTEYDNGMYICDMKNNPDNSGFYKSLKKIKLYRKLHTYGKQGDILQCGDSFAISDNLEVIDNGYRVTADGEIKIGVYL